MFKCSEMELDTKPVQSLFDYLQHYMHMIKELGLILKKVINIKEQKKTTIDRSRW